MGNRIRHLALAVSISVVVVVSASILGNLLNVGPRISAAEVFFVDAPVADALIRTRIITPHVTTQLIYPNITRGAPLQHNQVKVTGIIDCTAGQTLQLRATVTQGATTAAGEATERCTGHIQRWVIYATTSGGARLESGTAHVHVWSKTLEDGDVFEWDNTVRLAGRQ